MVKKIILYLVLPLVASIQGEECTLPQLNGCLQSVDQVKDLALVTTQPQLEAVCTSLKEGLTCVDEHMRKCFNPTQREVFNQLVAGARQVLLDLCVSGPIQETFLKHSPCYRDVSEQKCNHLSKHLVLLSEKVGKGGDVDDGLRETCCAFNEFVLCKYIHVRQECGHDAALFLQEHLDQISSPLIVEHCAHYTYAPDSCSASRARHLLEHSSVSFILTFSLLATLHKHIPMR